MSIWTGLKRTGAVLGSLAEAVSRALAVLNDFLNDANRSSAEFNRSLKERLEAGRTPALETQVKVLEAQIAHPEIFAVLPRQVCLLYTSDAADERSCTHLTLPTNA